MSRTNQPGLLRSVLVLLAGALCPVNLADAQSHGDGVVAALCRALSRLLARRDGMTITCYAGGMYVDGERIGLDVAPGECLERLTNAFSIRGIAVLRFRFPPRPRDLEALVTAFEESIHADERRMTPAEYAEQRLRALGTSAIAIRAMEAGGAPDPEPTAQERAASAWFGAMDVMASIVAGTRTGRPPIVRHALRAVQAFVDLLVEPDTDHAERLLLLTEVKNHRGYLCGHAVNTCLLSLVIGHDIGLNRVTLRRLGLAALLADIGSARVSSEILEDPAPLDPQDRAEVENHPVAGVPCLGRLSVFDSDVIEALVAGFEHHRHANGGGYPAAGTRKPGLFARIITIADRYDAMTSTRPYRGVSVSPPDALATLLADEEGALDSILVRVFARRLTPTPPGTLAVLDGGEVAVVLSRRGDGITADVLVLHDHDEDGEPVRGTRRTVPAGALRIDPEALADAIGDRSSALASSQAAAMIHPGL